MKPDAKKGAGSAATGPAARRRGRDRLRGLLAGLEVLGLLTLIWTGLHLLVARLGPQLGLEAASWGGGLAVFLGSFILFGFAMYFISLYIRGRHPDSFVGLNDAIRRIATGDFDVKVSLRSEEPRDPFGKVAGEINLMAQALKRMEEMRQEFISTASHEIQSPLTSIAGFARALREAGLSEDTRLHYLSIIEEESGRLSRLSDALLKLTTLESRGLELDARPTALDALLRSVVLAAQPLWSAKNLELKLDLERLEARVDEHMLNQVWTNLLHNAVKFSRPGGGISLQLHREGDLARFRIEDEGIGLAAEDLPFVFDRFFKADRSRSRSDQGTGSGLGLAIARKIVELHGGSISAESPGLGQGSAFTVELPL